MLIPELAKHMQSHHDEIDRQLLSQNDMLNSLQDTLKKEVDELKSLLNTTAMDIAMGMGSDNKNKRLHTILLQLKSDCSARGVYESEVDTTDRRILSQIEQVRKTLSIGSEQLGNSVVNEVVQQAIDKSDRDEAVADVHSPMLKELVKDLQEIQDFTTDVLVSFVDAEKRRGRTAEESFDHAVRNSRDMVFPQEVLDALKDSKGADVETDAAYDDIISVLRAFSDHIPQFVNMMQETEANLTRGLARTIEKGNQSLIEREQTIANKSIIGYLEDLHEAVKVLNVTVTDRMQPCAVKRGTGEYMREALVTAIDAALKATPTAGEENMQQLLEPLLNALQGAGGFQMPMGDGALPDDDGGALPPPVEEENVIDQEVVETVLNNENLSEIQKETILDSAENDMRVMESIIDLERQRQEEAIQHAIAMNENFMDAPEGQSNDADKYAAEQEALMASLLAARADELDKMMAAETGDDEAFSEQQVSCLARSGYAAFMRYWSSHARISYKELHMEYEMQRVQVQIGMYDSQSPIAKETGEKQLEALTNEEAAEITKMHESLMAMMQEGEARTEQQRAQWMKHADLVNVAMQAEQLTQEYKDQFAVLKQRLQDLSGRVREHCKASSALELAMLASRRNQVEEGVYSSLVETAKERIEASKDTIEALQEDDLRVLFAEEVQLFDMLQFAASWDGKSDERTAQQQLFMRQLGGIHVNTNIQNRLALVEFELQAEYEQIRAANDLLRRGADKAEVNATMQAMSQKKNDDEAKLSSALSDKVNSASAAELKRQQSAAVNYEKERAVAFAENAHQEITMSIQMHNSIRSAKREIEDVLAEKRAIMMDALSANIEPEVKELTLKQIDAECLREELELNTAYDSFNEGYMINERYLTEVVQGLEPSTGYIQQLVSLFNRGELHLMNESVYMEEVRRRAKKQLAGFNHKAFEMKRLKALNRPDQEIARLLDDVDAHTREMLNLVDVARSAEIFRIKEEQEKLLKEKLQMHENYETEVSEIIKRFEQEKSILRTKFENDLAYLSNAVEKRGDDVQSDPAIFRLQQEYTRNLAQQDMQCADKLNEAFKSVMSHIVAAEATADEIRVLRQRLNNETEALEEVHDDQVELRIEDLLQKQQERRSSEEKAYEAAGEDFSSRSQELAAKEDEESISLRRDIVEKEKVLHTVDSSHNAIVNAATDASKLTQANAEEEIKQLRTQYDKDLASLEDSLANKANKEKANLQKRLASKRNKRTSELKAEGKTEAEAATIVDREEKKEYTDLSEKLESERELALAEKKKEALEAESKLIEKQHEIATMAASNARKQKDHAQEHIRNMRAMHEQEAKALEDSMANDRKSQEEGLKSRLAARRANRLKDVQNEAQRAEEEARLKHEEHEQLMEMQRQQAEEEERQKEQLRIQAEADEVKAREELKQAEMEIAKASAQEAALRALKELQEQAEEDIAIQEAQRMRNMHEKHEEKRLADQEQQKKVGKSKLDERLAAKRAKREKELQEQERKAMEELQAKQKAEAEEKEAARIAKMAWSDKVQEIIDKAKTLGLSDFEREDYCFKETLGKGMVPEKQLSEAVNMVQKERHDAEMKALLTSNFEERISALKAAVEEVIQEKSKAKVDLVESLSGNGASDESIAEEVSKLNEEFQTKQMEAEKAATGRLESAHMKNQMDLRQKQLQEMANVVALYTDPESLARLQEAGGKSQEEELLAYKARIEEEKRAREEEIAKERADTEQKLRDKMKEDMEKIQSAMAEEQKKAEAEFERKKKEVEKQREELQKKHADEKGEIDKAEKARILSSFEKEQAAALDALERERKNKKAKLADRLNRRRKDAGGATAATAAGGAPDDTAAAPTSGPSAELVQSSNAVQQQQQAAQAAVASIGAKINAAQAAAAGTDPALAKSMNLIEAKLERIERVITTLEKTGIKAADGTAAATAGAAAGGLSSTSADLPAYQDRDEPAPGETLEVMPEGDIQIQDQARIEFGLRIAHMIGLKHLSIQAAYSLPPSTASGNAFCNSYYYSSGDNTLLVHTNRLSSSGDFGLVVIHALSHIKVNPDDLSNDNDPKFLAEFYKNLRILSQDLYKKSAASNTSKVTAGPPSAGGGGGAFSFPHHSPSGRPSVKRGVMKLGSFGKSNTEIQNAAAAVGNEFGGGDGAGAGAAGEGNPAYAHPANYFTADALHERMKQYAQQGGIPLDYLDRYAATRTTAAAAAAGGSAAGGGESAGAAAAASAEGAVPSASSIK